MQRHGGQAAPLNGTIRAPQASSLKPQACSLPRSGLTLVELLVVIVLLLIVTAVAIPVLSPNSEQRKIREGARLVSTFLSGARNRAIETGRPVGVQFERLAGNPKAAMVLNYVEVPPLYAGESLASVCKIFSHDPGSGARLYVNLDPNGSSDVNLSLIRTGDLIKINYQGHYYRIMGPPSTIGQVITASTVQVDLVSSTQVPVPWPTDSSSATGNNVAATYPYQISRQPIKAGGAPLQLPEGAVLDLQVSGESSNGVIDAAQSAWPIVLFSPSGAVAGVCYFDAPGSPTYRAPGGPIHLLVGRSDGVSTTTWPTDPGSTFTDPKVLWNLKDPGNLWVSIGTQTGLVSTTENHAINPITASASPDPRITEARSLAATFQSMGGR